tara:strand:+ start:1430 stop:2365 length:936 start_codon:yes stop_codon:yes gene_type:complete
MSRVTNLVTGGAGFLGSHLIDKLLNSEQDVICMDNYLTGNISNIERFLPHPNFTFINHDIINPILDVNAQRIWHLACPASPIHYQLNPIMTARINFLGTYNLLSLAYKFGSRILFSSTSEVYGDPDVHPQSEDYCGRVNPTGKRSCYDEGKRIAETLCADFERKYLIDIRIVRIFNTYGPRMNLDDGRVVTSFISSALKGEPIRVFGNGHQTRSFCYVEDLINGMELLMNSNYSKPINLGNPNEISILSLAEAIRSKIGTAVNITHLPLPEDDPLKRKPSIELAKDILGWQPNISLDRGLDLTIEWAKDNI